MISQVTEGVIDAAAASEDQAHAENDQSIPHDGEDDADIGNESEDEQDSDADGKLKTYENEPKTHDGKSEAESKTASHQAQETQEGENAPEVRKTVKSRGLLAKAGEKVTTLIEGATTMLGGVTTRLGGVTTKLGEAIGTVRSYVTGHDQRQLVYKKTISINLPHGRGPKRYCRLITYKPLHCKLSPEPVITLTIKPSGRCHHEDTHLFVRFAGYNYRQPMPKTN